MLGEMGPLAGSIGGASRLFPDPYREFRRDGLLRRCVRFLPDLVGGALHLLGRWVRFLIILVGSALHLFLLNRLPIVDSGFLRVLHQADVESSCFASGEYCTRLMWNLPVLRVVSIAPG